MQPTLVPALGPASNPCTRYPVLVLRLPSAAEVPPTRPVRLPPFQYHCRSRSSSTSSSPRFSCFSAARVGSRVSLSNCTGFPFQHQVALPIPSFLIVYSSLSTPEVQAPPNVQRLNRISSIVVASHHTLSFSSSDIAANLQHHSKLAILLRHSSISASQRPELRNLHPDFVPRYSEV